MPRSIQAPSADNFDVGAHTRPEMRALEQDTHTERLGKRAGRLVAWLWPRPPRCAFCPGTADDAWMIDPFGRVSGLCQHCLERMRARRMVTK